MCFTYSLSRMGVAMIVRIGALRTSGRLGCARAWGGEFVCALEVVVDEAVPCISGDGDGDAIEVA